MVEGISRGATVADARIEHPVGAEQHGAAVVVPEGLRDVEDRPLARRGLRRVLGVEHELRDHHPARVLGGVVEDEAPVLLELRVERQREKTFLVASEVHPVRQVEEDLRVAVGCIAGGVHLEHPPTLLDQHQRVLAIGAGDQLGRPSAGQLRPDANQPRRGNGYIRNCTRCVVARSRPKEPRGEYPNRCRGQGCH